jgi:hypothetical protein
MLIPALEHVGELLEAPVEALGDVESGYIPSSGGALVTGGSWSFVISHRSAVIDHRTKSQMIDDT